MGAHLSLSKRKVSKYRPFLTTFTTKSAAEANVGHILFNFGFMKSTTIPIAAILLAAAACGGRDNVEIPVERITTAEALASSPDGARIIMDAFGAGDTDPHSFADRFGQSEAMKIFGHDADSIMPSLRQFSADVSRLCRNMESILPATPAPRRIYATVIPYSQSVIILSDTCGIDVIAGLNHYLGADYEGYSSFAAYQRARKTPEWMTRDIAEAIVRTSHPFESHGHPTLLQRMLYEGAVAAALVRLTPGNDSRAIGLPADDFELLRKAEKEIWHRMAGSDLLFDRSERTAASLLREGAPGTVIGRDVPPLAGRFTGWRIVESYLKTHPDATPESLLQPAFYLSDTALREARYIP